ncbi:hypothetical protein [Dysgonomonas sp.]
MIDHLLKKRILYAIIGIGIVTAVFAGIASFNKIAGKRIILFAPDLEEYPLVDEYENIYKPIFGIVREIETHSGISFVTLSNGTKFSIDKFTKNFECEPSQLSTFIQVGDSIAKPGEDFLFFVHRKKICYPFKIKERLRALPVDMSKKQKVQ